MSILTWKLVDSLTVVSETKPQEIHQSFLLILLPILPANIQITQRCHSCTYPAESLPDKWQADIRTGKQESEGLYSSLTYHGNPSYFFQYLTKQSSEF